MRQNNKKAKAGFYEQYRQQEAEQREQDEIRERFGEELVVKKVSTVAEILRMLVELFGKFLKLMGWIIIVLLCSIAVTVLINESTRDAFFALLPTMGG